MARKNPAALFQLHRPTPCGRLPSGLPSPVLGPQDRRRKTGSIAEAAPSEKAKSEGSPPVNHQLELTAVCLRRASP